MLQSVAIDWRTLPRLTRSRSNEQRKERGTHVLRRSALAVWPETFVLLFGTSSKSIWPNEERVSKAFLFCRSKIHIYRGSRADFLNRHRLRRISQCKSRSKRTADPYDREISGLFFVIHFFCDASIFGETSGYYCVVLRARFRLMFQWFVDVGSYQFSKGSDKFRDPNRREVGVPVETKRVASKRSCSP